MLSCTAILPRGPLDNGSVPVDRGSPLPNYQRPRSSASRSCPSARAAWSVVSVTLQCSSSTTYAQRAGADDHVAGTNRLASTRPRNRSLKDCGRNQCFPVAYDRTRRVGDDCVRPAASPAALASQTWPSRFRRSGIDHRGDGLMQNVAFCPRSMNAHTDVKGRR